MARKKSKSGSKKRRKNSKPRSDKGKDKIQVKAEFPRDVMARLRLEAAHTYITTPGCSIPMLHRMEKFAGLHLTTIKRWCTDDRWVERREEWTDKWQTHILAQIGGDYLNVQTEQIRRFQELYDLGLAKVIQALQAKGFILDEKQVPAMVNAITSQFKALSSERLALAGHVIPEINSAVEAPMTSGDDTLGDDSEMHQALVPRFSRDEEREIISMILQSRRNTSRQAMLESGELTPEDLKGTEVDSKPKKRKPKKTVKR